MSTVPTETNLETESGTASSLQPPHKVSQSDYTIFLHKRVVEVTGLGTSDDSFLKSFSCTLRGRSVVGFCPKYADRGYTVYINCDECPLSDDPNPLLENVYFVCTAPVSSTEVEKAAFINLVLKELKSAPEPHNPILSNFKEWLHSIN